MTVSNSEYYLNLIKSFTPEVPGATIYAEAFNAVTSEVEAIETVLGTGLRSRTTVAWNSSADTFADLTARLNNMDAGIRSTAAGIHPQYALKSATVLQPSADDTALTVRQYAGSILPILSVQTDTNESLLGVTTTLISLGRATTVSGPLNVDCSTSEAVTARADSGYSGVVFRVVSGGTDVASIDAQGALTASTVTTDSLELTDFTGAQHDHSSAAQGGPIFPVGMVTAFAGGNPPSGWLLTDGSAVSRAVYSELFAVIGTSYGAGNGSTTFNVPNLQDRFPIGASGTLGQSGGTVSHTLSVDNLPSHDHTMDHTHPSVLSSVADTQHTHRVATSSYFLKHANTGGTPIGVSGSQVESVAAGAPGDMTGTPTQDHAHSVSLPAFAGSTSSVGSGTPISHTPKFLALNFIIKT